MVKIIEVLIGLLLMCGFKVTGKGAAAWLAVVLQVVVMIFSGALIWDGFH